MTKKIARIAFAGIALLVFTASHVVLSAQTGTDPKPLDPGLPKPPQPPPSDSSVKFTDVVTTILAIYHLS